MQRLVVQPARGRHEDGPVDALRVEVRELGDDGAAIELPTRVADSTPQSSRKPAVSCARSVMVRDSGGLPLRPNPGRSGTKVRNSPARRSAVGTR
jgi:hypothetical protein